MVQPAIEYRDVTFRYPGRADAAPALEHVSLAIGQGERIGLFGPNGGGKTTLLKLTLGLLQGYTGQIRVIGETPERAARHGIIGYVPQRNNAELEFPVSVRQAVAMRAARGVAPWRRLPGEARSRVDRALELVGMTDLADRPVGKLSGGQVQRTLMARALAGEPRILVLDEPDVGVDVAGQRRFASLLAELHRELGLTIVIVCHDLRTLAAGCDRVACLSRTLHYHESPRGLTPQVLAEVFSHDVAGVFGDVHVDAHPASECPRHRQGQGTHEHEGPDR